MPVIITGRDFGVATPCNESLPVAVAPAAAGGGAVGVLPGGPEDQPGLHQGLGRIQPVAEAAAARSIMDWRAR